MRGRGLKLLSMITFHSKLDYRRPREGAWIEISSKVNISTYSYSRPREGAWIEILLFIHVRDAVAGRPREGAWIEIASSGGRFCMTGVAPVRGRGLK